MLVRPDLHKLLKRDPQGKVLQHFLRAVRIRVHFSGLDIPGMDEILIPSCHEVAHAYALAFNTDMEDGLCVYVSKSGTDEFSHVTSQVMHSWNVVHVDVQKSVILDIFPDVGLSMMPVLYACPHPAYCVPEDAAFKKKIRELRTDRDFITTVELLADEFRRLEHKTIESALRKS